jgi:hypothetical protein
MARPFVINQVGRKAGKAEHALRSPELVERGEAGLNHVIPLVAYATSFAWHGHQEAEDGPCGLSARQVLQNKAIDHAATLTTARIRATMTVFKLPSQAHSLHVLGAAACRSINKPNQGELCYES